MRDKSLGVTETAKTAVAIGCPVSCVIVAANEAVQNDIGVVIRDPYGAGWLYRLRPIAWDEDSMFLMSASEYREWLAQHSKERLRKPDPQHHEMPPIDPQNISY